MPSNVQREIKQEYPFRSLGQEGVIALLRTASLVRRRFEQVMLKEGITFQQYNVLRILRGAADALPTMKVAERMIEPEPGITRLLGRLERKNLIRRVRSAEDGRSYLCSITQSGMEILSNLDQSVTDMDEGMIGDLTKEQQNAFVEYLDAIRNRLNQLPAHK